MLRSFWSNLRNGKTLVQRSRMLLAPSSLIRYVHPQCHMLNHLEGSKSAIVIAIAGLALSATSDMPARLEDAPTFQLTKEETTLMALLLNGVIDLPDLNEDQEQEIFEHIVTHFFEQLHELLPASYGVMMRKRELGLGEEALNALLTRLENSIPARVPLPFLDEQDERKVVYALTVVLVECLEHGKCMDDVLKNGPTSREFISIFIRGALGFLNDADMNVMTSTICGALEIPVPFPLLPAIKTALVSNLLEALAAIIDEAINHTLEEAFGPLYHHHHHHHHHHHSKNQEKKHSRLESLLVRNSDGQGLKTLCDHGDIPFIEHLKLNINTLINDKVNIPLLNEEQEGKLFANVINLWFKYYVKEEKIEAAIANLKKSDNETKVHRRKLVAALYQ